MMICDITMILRRIVLFPSRIICVQSFGHDAKGYCFLVE